MSATRALLERDEELASIERALADALDGSGGLLTIEGEAGAGKTALLDAARPAGGERRDAASFAPAAASTSATSPTASCGSCSSRCWRDAARRDELLGGSAALAAPVFDPTAAPARRAATRSPSSTASTGSSPTLAASAPLLLADRRRPVGRPRLAARARLSSAVASAACRSAGARRADAASPASTKRFSTSCAASLARVTIEPRPSHPTPAAVFLAAESESCPAERRLRRRLPRRHRGQPVPPGRAAARARLRAVRRRAGRRRAPRAGRGAGGLAIDPRPAGAARRALAIAVARAVAVLEPNAEARLDRGAQRACRRTSVADACERLVIAAPALRHRPVAFVHPLVRAAVLSELPTPAPRRRARPRRAPAHRRRRRGRRRRRPPAARRARRRRVGGR